MNMDTKKLLLLTTIAATAAIARADESVDKSAFNASLTPDIAVHPRTTQINGLTLSIWGENPQHSLALGFVNGTTGDSEGLSWGLVNYADSYTGVAWAVVNVSNENFVGWQGGLVNISQGKFVGFQSGWLNFSSEFHGFQLGLVNYAEDLHGVQVGFANIAMNNGWFDEFPDKLAKGFPIVNWSF